MAGPTVDQAFITKFEKDTHLTYRQMSSKFRGLVRTDAQVNGSTARFYKLGTVAASTKARNGEIPASNPDHAYVTCTMTDRYNLIYLDQLDLKKMNEDLRGSYVKAVAAAYGVVTDTDIITAMGTSTTTYAPGSGNWTRNGALTVAQKLDSNNVPRDGRRFCAVSPIGWAFLMTIDQFVRSDYTGPDDLQFKKTGVSIKTWNDMHWFVSTALSGVGTASCVSLAWHYDAVGHGINSDVDTMWDWDNARRAWSLSSSMSMGASLIDTTGVVKITLDDTAALP